MAAITPSPSSHFLMKKTHLTMISLSSSATFNPKVRLPLPKRHHSLRFTPPSSSPFVLKVAEGDAHSLSPPWPMPLIHSVHT
ncbi:hypothetical protein K1719_039719 [Acacia pycnantha]|nr:hypothetical protein K1719_039719 [Acacia pycnantha]